MSRVRARYGIQGTPLTLSWHRSAVGDSLRAIYDNLSRDPNSLSNLDQDLPNYAQTVLAIIGGAGSES